MKFSKMIKLLRSGESLTRPELYPGHIEISSNEKDIIFTTDEMQVGVVFTFDMQDIEATDWKIVE